MRPFFRLANAGLHEMNDEMKGTTCVCLCNGVGKCRTGHAKLFRSQRRLYKRRCRDETQPETMYLKVSPFPPTVLVYGSSLLFFMLMLVIFYDSPLLLLITCSICSLREN